jgi:cation diffusion facilitator family transporter
MAGHEHPRGAHHGHDHAAAVTAGDERRVLWALVLTGGFTVAEAAGGILSGSLALLADAGHMATDALGIGLALGAVSLAQRPPSGRRTFGWQRVEILAAVANGVLLLGVGAYVLVEAVRRIGDPHDVQAGVMLIAAGAGLLVNLIGLAVLHRGRGESLNVRGAYLEVLSDALGSVAVLAAAAVIAATGWTPADTVASLLIGCLVLPRAWSLLREALDVLLEAAPRGVDLDEVRAHILEVDGVLGVHDLHAWTITSGLPVLSAHVVVAD